MSILQFKVKRHKAYRLLTKDSYLSSSFFELTKDSYLLFHSMIQSTHVSSAHDTIYVQVEHLPGKNICLTDSHPQVTWPDVALPSMPTGRSHRPSEALGLEMSSCGTTRHGAANWRPMRLLPASTARWYLLNMIQSMYLLNMIVSVYIEVEYLSGKNVYPSLSPSSHFGLSSNYYSEPLPALALHY